MLDQIERFAPGLRERIVASSVSSPAAIEANNLNYVGGDIVAGANTPVQTLIRPRLALDPYPTGAPGLFICSGGDAARRRRPRHERLQRGPVGAALPAAARVKDGEICVGGPKRL